MIARAPQGIEIDLPDPLATERLAADLAAIARVGDLFALSGDLGAGKTAFARAFIRALGDPDDEVPSPTFTLLQTYDCAKGTIYHFDVYRLEDPNDVWELDFEDALADGITLIEWPERLGGLMPPERLLVGLAHGATPNERRVTLSGPATWMKRLNEAGFV